MKNVLRFVVGTLLVLAGFVAALFAIVAAIVLINMIPDGIGNVLYDIVTWGMISLCAIMCLGLAGVLGYEIGCKIFK